MPINLSYNGTRIKMLKNQKNKLASIRTTLNQDRKC